MNSFAALSLVQNPVRRDFHRATGAGIYAAPKNRVVRQS
jgi:hypothetical protein